MMKNLKYINSVGWNNFGPMSRFEYFQRKIYHILRVLFWKSFDPNEDFGCGNCGRPVFRRFLYCNARCSQYFDHHHEAHGPIARDVAMVEALGYYANPAHYESTPSLTEGLRPPGVLTEGGEKARKATGWPKDE